MDYVNIKNLNKYHAGYKDRNLIWCKVYFSMINSDPEFEMLDEIDKWRFIAFIILQLQSKKPTPIDNQYLLRKGFNLKKRPISLTLQMLHNFIVYVTKEDIVCNVDIDKEVDKEEKSNVTDFLDYFNLKTNKKLTLTEDRKNIIKKRLSDGYSFEQLKKAVDNFIQDDWPDRYKHIDIIYCIGKQRGKPDNLEKWLNQSTKHTNKSLAYD